MHFWNILFQLDECLQSCVKYSSQNKVTAWNECVSVIWCPTANSDYFNRWFVKVSKYYFRYIIMKIFHCFRFIFVRNMKWAGLDVWWAEWNQFPENHWSGGSVLLCLFPSFSCAQSVIWEVDIHEFCLWEVRLFVNRSLSYGFASI